MPYAVVQDVAASWDEYGAVAAALAGDATGLLLHAAGPTDEGFRTIEVWDSEADWRRFHRDRLGEAFADLSAPPVVRELPVHALVTGPSHPLPDQTRSHA